MAPQSTIIRRKSVFVSKHATMNVAAKDILDYCGGHGIDIGQARATSTHVILRECPFCSKPTNDKPDNLYKLYVQVGSGAYFCHRCGAGGSWFDLKSKVGGVVQSSQAFGQASAGGGKRRGHEIGSHPHVKTLPMPPQRLQAIYSTDLFASPNPILDYLTNTRCLKASTLRKYGVGKATYSFLTKDNQWTDAECVTFSWIMSVGDAAYQEELRGAKFEHEAGKSEDVLLTRRIKARALENKAWQRLDPPGGAWGFFGYHTIPSSAKEVILTEGEYDAMAVWQATGRPAISLPNGCRSLPVETLPMLEEFDRIYLWMDNDGPGQEGAELFARKIGLERCYLVRPTKANTDIDDGVLPKDANEALLMGLDLDRILQDAKLTPHERIISFDELRDDVLHEIMHPEKYIGTPLPSLPKFTSNIAGLRRGELTVLTGPTGAGKTTFLGQMSLDLAEQDINVLWGSFEIKNTRLLHKLLQQYARKPLPKGDPSMMSELEALADRFAQLPLHFLKFHGGSDIDDVLDAMEYAVYVNDCQHIILDNMQFMISRQSSNSSWDKFDIQDIAVERFRKFATERNVHVTLVVHPRKEQEASQLSISSIYGSAKATQEADTVVIIQSDGNRKFLDVRKNRFNGTLGHSPLYFDRQTNRYCEEPVLNSGKKLPDLPIPKLQAEMAEGPTGKPRATRLGGPV